MEGKSKEIIIEKVKKLLALSENNGNEYEAAAAAEKARELLEAYDLSMADLKEKIEVEITKSQIDSWSAESKENHRFPLIYTGAFCRATQHRGLAHYISELCGGYYIEGEDAIRLELGKIEEEKERIAIREFLSGNNNNGGAE